MKKVLIQSEEQLALVREEIYVSSLFNHPNLLPLLDHAIIAVKVMIRNSLWGCYEYSGFTQRYSNLILELYMYLILLVNTINIYFILFAI